MLLRPISMRMEWSDDLDARGLLCPLPVLKLRKRLKPMAPGAVIRCQTTDPAAVIDIPHFCTQDGHLIRSSLEVDEGMVWMIEKGGAA